MDGHTEVDVDKTMADHPVRLSTTELLTTSFLAGRRGQNINLNYQKKKKERKEEKTSILYC